MRIVGGTLRSRTLRAPRGDSTRPTTDRVRESLFAVIGPLAGARILDLFTGTAALAIEAVSRGASIAVGVECARSALQAARSNVSDLGLADQVFLIARRVADAGPSVVQYAPYDLVFADPPWAELRDGRALAEISTLLAQPILAPSALIVIEHAARDPVPRLPGVELEDTRVWGDTAVAFFRYRDAVQAHDAPQQGEPVDGRQSDSDVGHEES